jgi:hypothetical protein
VIRLRTSELAKLAEEAGFTPTECHRAMLDGAMLLLRNLATTPQPGATAKHQEQYMRLAAALEAVQMQVTFMEVGT